MKYGVQHDLMREKESKGQKQTPAAKEKENVNVPPRRSSICELIKIKTC